MGTTGTKETWACGVSAGVVWGSVGHVEEGSREVFILSKQWWARPLAMERYLGESRGSVVEPIVWRKIGRIQG